MGGPEPIGVYNEPSPDDAAPGVQSVRMADADSLFAGVGLLLRDATRLRDRAARFKDRVLGL